MNSNPPDLAGVIFDLDGTLTDTLAISFSAFRAAMARFSDRRFTDAELIAWFGPSEDGIIRSLLPEAWERCFEEYVKEYAARHAGCATAFPGIDATLDLLTARGLRLAVVTGKSARTAAITLQHVKIAHYFDMVETGSAEGGVKARALGKILDRWALEGRRVAYVGDAMADMEAASAVGMLAVGAAWAGTARVDDLKEAGAHVVFTSVDDFRRWLGPE